MPSTGSPTPAWYRAPGDTSGLSLKLKLLQFLVTRFGLVISGAASFLVTAVLAFLAVKLGVDLRENQEMVGALLLFVNQAIWGGVLWAVKTYEMPFKRELQEILGGGITIDGLIGAQTVARAIQVKEVAQEAAGYIPPLTATIPPPFPPVTPAGK